MIDWQLKFERLSGGTGDTDRDEYFEANKDVVATTLQGRSPHGGQTTRPGIRVVFNIPARLAIRFLLPNTAGPGYGVYLNRHNAPRPVGQPLTGNTARDRIDEALSDVSADLNLVPLGPTNAHYGAMEVNGTGIRYFGDICLVLKDQVIDAKTLTLLRNSYDLLVKPVFERLKSLSPANQDAEARNILRDEWAGEWAQHGHYMAGIKMMETAPRSVRRMTTAHVSQGVLDDEDYVEVVRAKGFEPDDLVEIRVRAEDAAAEALTGDQSRAGRAPYAAHALWRYRRRMVAWLALGHKLPVRVVTTSGRTR